MEYLPATSIFRITLLESKTYFFPRGLHSLLFWLWLLLPFSWTVYCSALFSLKFSGICSLSCAHFMARVVAFHNIRWVDCICNTSELDWIVHLSIPSQCEVASLKLGWPVPRDRRETLKLIKSSAEHWCSKSYIPCEVWKEHRLCVRNCSPLGGRDWKEGWRVSRGKEEQITDEGTGDCIWGYNSEDSSSLFFSQARVL